MKKIDRPRERKRDLIDILLGNYRSLINKWIDKEIQRYIETYHIKERNVHMI